MGLSHTLCENCIARAMQSMHQLQVVRRFTAHIAAAINRGTRPNPKKVNLVQVVSQRAKRGPTTFDFMP